MNKAGAQGNNLLDLPDFTVSYRDSGTGSLPIIFIHGFPFDQTTWQPQLEFLATRHRVITYDIRGFGRSSAGTKKAGIRLYADDLIHLLDYLEIPKAVVCGLSMGGYILLNAVSRYPVRFEAIILCDTQCIADTPEGKEKRYQTIGQIQEGHISEFAEGFVKNIFCKTTLENKKEVVDKIKNIIRGTSPSTLTGGLTALAEREEKCSSLHTITIPSLILCGREDVLTPPAQAETLHNGIAHSTCHIIEDAGHLSNLEQPQLVNRYIDEFISIISKQAR